PLSIAHLPTRLPYFLPQSHYDPYCRCMTAVFEKVPQLDFSQKLNELAGLAQPGTSDRSRRFRERSRASTSCGPCFQKSSSDPWRSTSRKVRNGRWLEWDTGALSGLQCGDQRLRTPCRSSPHHST